MQNYWRSDRNSQQVSRLLKIFATCALFISSAAQALEHPKLEPLIQELVSEHQFDESELRALFKQAKIKSNIIDTIQRPAESKPWHWYKKLFVNDKRIAQGVEYWQENKAILARAEKETGVPAHMIVAIIGVETRYGRQTGGFRVLDALSTLSFEYPPREAFFRKQLIEYLQLTRKESIDPLSLEGSYAGAIGIPQFIPSSYRVYAVDFNQDGVRDLLNSHEDAIGSVANYFKVHDWRPNQPVVVPTIVKNPPSQAQLDTQLKPTRTLHAIAELGAWVPNDLAPNQVATLMKLDGKNGDEYWIGLHNFYVITRYNRSRLYALAVYLLSERIRFEYQHSNQGDM